MATEGQNNKKKDYSGQHLKVGIDVHKKSWEVTVCSANLILKTFSYAPKAEGLVRYLKKEYPGAEFESCYEAGYFGYWIHRKLEELGVKNLVVNPSDVPTKGKEKNQKTDRIDSRKLAKCLRGGLLEGIYVPSEEQEQDRQLLRTRKKLVRDITRIKNRIKGWLSYNGIIPPPDLEQSKWSKKYIEWVSNLNWDTMSGKEVIQSQLEYLKSSKSLLTKLNRKIVELSRSAKYESSVELIRSIKGFGILSSMVLLTEIGNIDRFKNEGQLRRYAGLIPTQSSSADKQFMGTMTKRGNSYIKEVLIECSWRAVGSDPSLMVYYEELKKRMKGNNAIVRIAVKLLRRIRAMLRSGELYEAGRP